MKTSKDKYFLAAAFIAAFGFFAFAYPYHLMRREQMTLFLYDIPYIIRTYSETGGLSRFLGDFVEQFFCMRLAGPAVIALLLTLTGWLSYKICRLFMGKKLSFVTAALIFIWAFLRETDTLYITQYSIAVAGYLLCLYIALSFKKTVTKVCALPAFMLTAVVLFGSPYHQYYGKLIGKPDFDYEKLIGMDVEASRENWDKVLDISKSHPLYTEACYLHNLAAARTGQLSGTLLSHPQNYSEGLFLTVKETPFFNGAAGEAWFHLGNMTLADQSAMVALQFSPKHTGARFIQRLAMINIISEEYGAAEKYLKMLGKTLMYHKWAGRMTPGYQDEQTRSQIDEKRRNLVKEDAVCGTNDYRLFLKELLAANPGNSMAREYLLCFDLLTCNLKAFMEDYVPGKDTADIYQEAVLIWLNLQYNSREIGNLDFNSYGITETTLGRLEKFYRFPERYKNTYWYYYTYAMDE